MRALSGVLMAAVLGVALAGAGPAAGQSLSPMRDDVVSFGDRFAFQLVAGNPNDRAVTLVVRVFDVNWNELDDVWVSRPLGAVAPGGRHYVLIVAPFAGLPSREIRVCAETLRAPGAGAQIRGQVCGRYRARRA